MSNLNAKQWEDKLWEGEGLSSFDVAAIIGDLKIKEQKNEKLLSALMSMTMQYLQYSDNSDDPVFTHDFMSAGEETLALLVELGIMTEIKPSYFKLVKKDEEK